MNSNSLSTTLPKSERATIDNKRSSSVANTHLKFASGLKNKKGNEEERSASKRRHRRNKIELKTSIPVNGHERRDSTNKSFVYSELDDSIEKRRKKHIRSEAQSLTKKYAQ